MKWSEKTIVYIGVFDDMMMVQYSGRRLIDLLESPCKANLDFLLNKPQNNSSRRLLEPKKLGPWVALLSSVHCISIW